MFSVPHMISMLICVSLLARPLFRRLRPDGHPLGEPVIPNGLALCKLHHAAFDRYLIGVTPDLEVTVRLDLLEEIDGPMLLHGPQGFQGRRIHVPRADHLEPNRDFLAERYALSRRAS